jgi:TRAP transporter 4TM/12TM fusion protein
MAEIDKSKEILEKYDTESRYRTFEKGTFNSYIISFVAIALSLFHLYTSWRGPLVTLQHRAVHTGIVMFLVFLLYPLGKKSSKSKVPLYDYLFAVVAAATAVYIVADYRGIVARAGMPSNLDVMMGIIAILIVLEAGRRVTGKEIVILAVLFMAYAYFGQRMPGFFSHRGYNIRDIAEYMYLTTEGIYGIAIGVSSTYIFLFILFGAFLQKSGMGSFFNDLAMAIAGSSKGGPAKVAVISSGLLGSINGSAVANVVTTGSFTIPLMKKIGYSPEFAGAVEAAASVGGQILPPVMGAAAFIMAEALDIPYIKIAAAAAIPALLYYLAVILIIHFRASKKGLKGISRENLPRVWDVLRSRGHLLIPLVVLIYLLVTGKTPIFAAFWSIIVTVVVSMLRKETRMSIRDIIEALELGARTALGVAMSCAIVGLIVGVATLTGLGLKLAGAILILGQNKLLLTLVFTMIACIILGMGLPSIPAYIITSTMAAPALAKLGVMPLTSHMFVFYFGMLANLTPPVALAAFAGAGIAGSNPTRTGFASLKLALAGFIVPYIFVYSPSLMLINTTPVQAVVVTVTAIVGIIGLAAAVEGYLVKDLNMAFRIILVASSLLLIKPGIQTDIIGFIVLAVVFAIQFGSMKKLSKKTPTALP